MARNNAAAIFIIVVVAFAAGVFAGVYKEIGVQDTVRAVIRQSSAYSIDDTNFEPANVSIVGAHVTIESRCRAISFDVTEDQAFSIQRALTGQFGTRPLTHDILKDVIENFNITIRRIRIEHFGEEIYYARMFIQQGDRVLDIDMRPSDAIALSLRTGDKLYANQTMMQEKGEYVC